MRRLFFLIYNDLRNIFRDKALISIAIAPLLMIMLLAFLMPVLFIHYPAHACWYPLIVASTSLIIASFPAYILSFVMLDETDQHITAVMRVLPVPRYFFISYRIFLVWMLAFVFSLITFSISGLFFWLKGIAIALAISSIAPITLLIAILHAKNKIEAATWFKFINMWWMMPLVAMITPFPGSWLLGVIPTYWYFGLFCSPHMFYVQYSLFWLMTMVYGVYLGYRIRYL